MNRKEYNRRYYQEHKEEQARRQKAWREKNREKSRDDQRIWRATHKERLAEIRRKYNGTARGVYNRLKNVCNRKGRSELTISREEFISWWAKTPQVCCYCGRPVGRGQGLSCRTIDRRDCNQGYCLGNLVIACLRCNIMKGSWLSYEQMLDAARRYF